jgi:signal transduction histidine kinase/CheY-like chemotaxis protein
MQAAASSLDVDSLLHRAGEAISRRLGLPSALYAVDPLLGGLRPVAMHDSTADDIHIPMDIEVDRTMDPTLIDVVETRGTHQVDFASSDLGEPFDSLTRQLRLQSAIYVPLVSRGRTRGVLQVFQQAGSPELGEQEMSFAEVIASNLSVALENARLFQDAVDTAERLKEVDRLKSQFLANMSHELRTPLNSIIGFSRVILKGIDGPLTDLQQQDLEAIYNSGQHLLGLINDILDISKIEAGKMELAFEPGVDLREIVNGVMSTAIAFVKDLPVELQQEIPDDLPTIMADSRRIRQVLLNLVNNACKFTEEGYVRVEAAVVEGYVHLSVKDTGIGIPEDKIANIFEAFTQADASPSRKYGGTGLGLTISKSFVNLHGGDILIESDVGSGSTFIIVLPIEGPPPPTEEELLEDELERGLSESASRLVLCVDDDEGVITLFRRYLEKQGYQVVGLTDATRTVEEAKRLDPFAITLDVMMPGKDGWQIINELKDNDDTQHIPVIMCTIVGERDRGLSLGASDYLVKPVLERDLLASLDRLDREEGEHLVLVVDDQEEDRKLLRRMIESQDGYEVIEASGGSEAIAAVKRSHPHMIVLDLLMPDIDGFAVLEEVKADPTTRSIPIIVVTAKDLTEDDREMLNSRIGALIQKGVLDREELLEDVSAALRKLSSVSPVG